MSGTETETGTETGTTTWGVCIHEEGNPLKIDYNSFSNELSEEEAAEIAYEQNKYQHPGQGCPVYVYGIYEVDEDGDPIEGTVEWYPEPS